MPPEEPGECSWEQVAWDRRAAWKRTEVRSHNNRLTPPQGSTSECWTRLPKAHEAFDKKRNTSLLTVLLVCKEPSLPKPNAAEEQFFHDGSPADGASSHSSRSTTQPVPPQLRSSICTWEPPFLPKLLASVMPRREDPVCSCEASDAAQTEAVAAQRQGNLGAKCWILRYTCNNGYFRKRKLRQTAGCVAGSSKMLKQILGIDLSQCPNAVHPRPTTHRLYIGMQAPSATLQCTTY